YLHGARTIPTQNDALRFVHFVDQLYDRALVLRVSGEGDIAGVFDATYRESAYAKKHHRCVSRLAELLVEPAERPALDVPAAADCPGPSAPQPASGVAGQRVAGARRAHALLPRLPGPRAHLGVAARELEQRRHALGQRLAGLQPAL